MKKEKIEKFTTLSCSVYTKKLVDLLKIQHNKNTLDELLQEMACVYVDFKNCKLKRVGE